MNGTTEATTASVIAGEASPAVIMEAEDELRVANRRIREMRESLAKIQCLCTVVNAEIETREGSPDVMKQNILSLVRSIDIEATLTDLKAEADEP